jgi:GNAT superfamily N-acetyltransferase
MSAVPIVRELSSGETDLAYRAMREIHPTIGSATDFADRARRLRRTEGYRLVASFEDGEAEASAVAGFRTGHFAAWGYALHCDELAIRADRRGRGHAGDLTEWLIGEASRLGCGQIHVDPGVGALAAAAVRRKANPRPYAARSAR